MKTQTSSFHNYCGNVDGAKLAVCRHGSRWRAFAELAAGLVGLLLGGAGRSGQNVWTNTAGGNWNVPAHWNSNQVTAPADDAVITTHCIWRFFDPTATIFAKRFIGRNNWRKCRPSFQPAINL